MDTQMEIAILLENLDIPRAPARITALLLVSDPPALSFGAIQDTLGISKAAVSVALHYLEALGLIRYASVSGTRRRLVFLEPANFVHYLRRRMHFFRAFADSLQAVADKHGDTSSGKDMQRLAELCRQLDDAVMTILTTWEEESHEEFRRDSQTPAGTHPVQE